MPTFITSDSAVQMNPVVQMSDDIPAHQIKNKNILRNDKIEHEKSELKHIEKALKQYKENQRYGFKTTSILFTLYHESWAMHINRMNYRANSWPLQPLPVPVMSTLL